MEYPIVVNIEAVVLENGEIISYGKKIGRISKHQLELCEAGATKLARGGEMMIAINGQTA